MENLNSWKKQFIAKVKGDNTEVIMEKVWRKAKSALDAQIANNVGVEIDLTDNRDNAIERLNDAILNDGLEITKTSDYVNKLIDAKNKLKLAEKALEDHKALTTFLNECLVKLKD